MSLFLQGALNHLINRDIIISTRDANSSLSFSHYTLSLNLLAGIFIFPPSDTTIKKSRNHKSQTKNHKYQIPIKSPNQTSTQRDERKRFKKLFCLLFFCTPKIFIHKKRPLTPTIQTLSGMLFMQDLYVQKLFLTI